MSTPIEYIEFVCEQIHCDFALRYKKMFGDYVVYANDKPILLVCDSTVYVKKAGELAELLGGAECGVPYDGAKEHYVLDIEDVELVKNVVTVLERITPTPKPRKKADKL